MYENNLTNSPLKNLQLPNNEIIADFQNLILEKITGRELSELYLDDIYPDITDFMGESIEIPTSSGSKIKLLVKPHPESNNRFLFLRTDCNKTISEFDMVGLLTGQDELGVVKLINKDFELGINEIELFTRDAGNKTETKKEAVNVDGKEENEKLERKRENTDKNRDKENSIVNAGIDRKKDNKNINTFNEKLENFKELGEMNIPEIKWIIPDLLPEGLTILSGKPKTGKSWAAIGMAFEISSGGLAFNHFPCKKGKVLYLALEDSQRRLQKRRNKILESKDENFDIDSIKNIIYKTDKIKSLEQGGKEFLIETLKKEQGIDLIIIDTLNRFAPPKNGDEGYSEMTRILSILHEIAKEYQIGIILIHHNKKGNGNDNEDPMDMILGSTAISGVSDTLMVFKKNKNGTVLYVKGRDVEDIEIAIEFNKETCIWEYKGDAKTIALSEERKKILEVLDYEIPYTPKEIAEMGNLNYGSVRILLRKMLEEGIISQPEKGKYCKNPGG
jgi:hypothetical protein